MTDGNERPSSCPRSLSRRLQAGSGHPERYSTERTFLSLTSISYHAPANASDPSRGRHHRRLFRRPVFRRRGRGHRGVRGPESPLLRGPHEPLLPLAGAGNRPLRDAARAGLRRRPGPGHGRGNPSRGGGGPRRPSAAHRCGARTGPLRHPASHLAPGRDRCARRDAALPGHRGDRREDPRDGRGDHRESRGQG